MTDTSHWSVCGSEEDDNQRARDLAIAIWKDHLGHAGFIHQLLALSRLVYALERKIAAQRLPDVVYAISDTQIYKQDFVQQRARLEAVAKELADIACYDVEDVPVAESQPSTRAPEAQE